MEGKKTVIGFTGGSGAGKTTALGVLRELGGFVIDCDELYHEMLLSDWDMLLDIRTSFGDVFTEGVLDRKKLGAIVFGDPEKLELLNRVTHGHIRRRVYRMMVETTEMGVTVFGIDAIALIESGFSSMCDAVIGVLAPPEIRVRRIMAREGLTREYALLRIRAQQPDSFFQEHCSHILVNDDGDKEAFRSRCRELLNKIIGGNRDE